MKRFLCLFFLPLFLRGMDLGSGALRSAIYEGSSKAVLRLILNGAVVDESIRSYSDSLLHRGLAIEISEYDGSCSSDISNSYPMLSDRLINIMVHYPILVAERNWFALQGSYYGIGGEYHVENIDIIRLQALLPSA